MNWKSCEITELLEDQKEKEKEKEKKKVRRPDKGLGNYM